MTAGVCHTGGSLDGCAVIVRQLGETVRPAVCCAVCGGCVNDAGVIVFDQGDGLPCRRVGQAQEHDVGCIQEPAAFFGIFALIFVDQQQLEVVTRAQTLIDLQAGGAFLAVDVNFGTHQLSPP